MKKHAWNPPPPKKICRSMIRTRDLKASAYPLGKSAIALERVIFPKVLIIHYGCYLPLKLPPPETILDVLLIYTQYANFKSHGNEQYSTTAYINRFFIPI